MVDKAKGTNIVTLLQDSPAYQKLISSDPFEGAWESLKNTKGSSYNPDAGDSYSFGGSRSFNPDMGGTIKTGPYRTSSYTPKKKPAAHAKHTPAKPKQEQPKLKASKGGDTFYRPDTEYVAFGSGRSFNPDLGGTIKLKSDDKKTHRYAAKVNRQMFAYSDGLLKDRKASGPKVDPEVVAKYKNMRLEQRKAQRKHKTEHVDPPYRLVFNPYTGIYKAVYKS